MAYKATNKHGLTDQQHKFCLLFLADPDKNATAAYRKAYPNCKSEGAANASAARLLANDKVRRFLDAQREVDEKKAVVDREFVLEKLRDMAEVGLNKRPVKDKEGNVTHHRFVDAYAGSKGVELLGKHFKMFTDKVEHSGEIRHTGVLKIGGDINIQDWLTATGGSIKTEE